MLEEMCDRERTWAASNPDTLFFGDDATTGDGLLTALKMACLVALEGSLEKVTQGLKIFPQTILNVRVKSKPPLESLPEVAQALRDAEAALRDSGRVILRYSGTEPKARVMVEAERPEDVKQWASRIASAIQSAIGAV